MNRWTALCLENCPSFFALCLGGLWLLPGAYGQSDRSVKWVILHTNDLHSHLLPEKSIPERGGLARIRTQVEKIRNQNPNTLLLDGGDWSEGTIYYTAGGGVETHSLLSQMGYDAIVVGNHDWINGPKTLLQAIEPQPRGGKQPRHLSSNLDLSLLPPSLRESFQRQILPYTVFEREGARIAVIGVSTYEFIYDSFFAPVRIQSPLEAIRRSVRELRGRADAFILLSHNSIETNQVLLEKIPEIDLVVGGHDHVKLQRPVRVPRPNHPDGWIVETGAWGHYLGQVEIEVFPDQNRRPILRDARLIAINRSIQSHPETQARISALQAQISKQFGPIFDDQIGYSEVHLSREGIENRIGNFATDAYRQSVASADGALEVIKYIYGEIHPGPIQTSDVFNANPAVYNPDTQQTWNLHTLPIQGKNLAWVLSLLLSSKKITQLGLLSVSGIQAIFDFTDKPGSNPQKLDAAMIPGQVSLAQSFDEETFQSARLAGAIEINGEILEKDRMYSIVVSEGVVKTIEFINSLFRETNNALIPLRGLLNTGYPAWRSMADRVKSNQTLTAKNSPIGGRLISSDSDLGIFADEIQILKIKREESLLWVDVEIPIRNLGLRTNHSEVQLQISADQLGNNFTEDSVWQNRLDPISIPQIPPKETYRVKQTFSVPCDAWGVGHFRVQILGVEYETSKDNNQALRWIRSPTKAEAELKPLLRR